MARKTDQITQDELDQYAVDQLRSSHDEWCIVTTAHDADECTHLTDPINQRLRIWAVVDPAGVIHSTHATRTQAANVAQRMWHNEGGAWHASEVLLRVEAVTG